MEAVGNDEVTRLHVLRESIERALRDAQDCIDSSFKDAKDSKVGGWKTNYFREPFDAPMAPLDDLSVTGTACSITATLAIGAVSSSTKLDRGVRFLEELRPEGWKDRLNGTFITRVACMAIHALMRTGRCPCHGEAVRGGVKLLFENQNDDHGWGFCERASSDVTSTCYAIKALAKAARWVARCETTGKLHDEIKERARRGCEWLEGRKKVDGNMAFWDADEERSGRPTVNSSVAITSHAVEALLADDASPEPLQPVLEWLKMHPPTQAVERAEDKWGSRRFPWTHLPEERALTALMRLEAPVSDVLVVGLAERILARQLGPGYWAVQGDENNGPSWAVIEAVISLRLLQDRLDADPVFRLDTLERRIERLEGNAPVHVIAPACPLDTLENRLEILETRSVSHRMRRLLARVGPGVGVLVLFLLPVLALHFWVAKLAEFKPEDRILAEAVLGAIVVAIVVVFRRQARAAQQPARDGDSSR